MQVSFPKYVAEGFNEDVEGKICTRMHFQEKFLNLRFDIPELCLRFSGALFIYSGVAVVV